MICLSCLTLFIGLVLGIADYIAGLFGKFGPHDYKAYIFYISLFDWISTNRFNVEIAFELLQIQQ